MQVALFRGVFFPDRGLGLRAEQSDYKIEQERLFNLNRENNRLKINRDSWDYNKRFNICVIGAVEKKGEVEKVMA